MYNGNVSEYSRRRILFIKTKIPLSVGTHEWGQRDRNHKHLCIKPTRTATLEPHAYVQSKAVIKRASLEEESRTKGH